jgi:putative transposase
MCFKGTISACIICSMLPLWKVPPYTTIGMASQAELVGIWDQPTKQEALTQLAAFKAKYSKRYPEAVRSLVEDEEHLLTFYAFPQSMHRHIQTTNAIESLFSNVRQRTDQIDVFTTEISCLVIVWATIQDIRLHKISVG